MARLTTQDQRTISPADVRCYRRFSRADGDDVIVLHLADDDEALMVEASPERVDRSERFLRSIGIKPEGQP